MSKRSVLKTVKILGTLLLTGYIVFRVSEHGGASLLWERTADIDFRFVFIASALQFLVIGVGTHRWQRLLSERGIRCETSWLYRHYLVGRFIGAFTPSTIGLDVYRASVVGKAKSEPARSISAVVSEKFYGLMGLSLLALLTLPFGGYELIGPSASLLALGVAGGSVLGVVVMSRPGWFRWLPAPLFRRVQAAFEVQSSGPERVTLATLSFLGHTLTALVYVIAAFALGLQVPFSTLLVVSTTIIIATLLPISIGGIGVREGVAVVLLGQVGVVPIDAVLVGMIGYLTGQLPALAGGLFLLLPNNALERSEPEMPLHPSSAGGISAP